MSIYTHIECSLHHALQHCPLLWGVLAVCWRCASQPAVQSSCGFLVPARSTTPRAGSLMLAVCRQALCTGLALWIRTAYLPGKGTQWRRWLPRFPSGAHRGVEVRGKPVWFSSRCMEPPTAVVIVFPNAGSSPPGGGPRACCRSGHVWVRS